MEKAVNNECGATHYIKGEQFACNQRRNHGGDRHWQEDWYGRVTTWPRQFAKTTYSSVIDEDMARIKADLIASCERLDALFKEDEEAETSVLLTLADLKVISYYLAEADEDDADTVEKIDAALKEML